MEAYLNTIGGLFGISGGILWFLAAGRTPAPAQGAYMDVKDSPDSPFARKWRKATWLNQAAAIATGISALLFGLAGLIKA